jgi:hypothetical protein
MLILFAASGALQMFGIKIPILYEMHTKGYGSLPFVVGSFSMGFAVVATSILGIVMAFQLNNDRKTVLATLIFGSVLPILFMLIAYLKR